LTVPFRKRSWYLSRLKILSSTNDRAVNIWQEKSMDYSYHCPKHNLKEIPNYRYTYKWYKHSSKDIKQIIVSMYQCFILSKGFELASGSARRALNSSQFLTWSSMIRCVITLNQISVDVVFVLLKIQYHIFRNIIRYILT